MNGFIQNELYKFCINLVKFMYLYKIEYVF